MAFRQKDRLTTEWVTVCHGVGINGHEIDCVALARGLWLVYCKKMDFAEDTSSYFGTFMLGGV